MVNANELRIGNYILDDDGNVGVVASIESEKFNQEHGIEDSPIQFSLIGKDGYWYAPVINGIPLTEEWLLKLGFWKSKHGYFEKIPVKRFQLEQSENDSGTWFLYSGVQFGDDEQSNLIAIIASVHQLQNFWSACNLGELTIQ
jgi:hypothetical protein